MPLTPRDGGSSMTAKYEAYAALYKARMHQTHYGVETLRVLTVCKSEPARVGFLSKPLAKLSTS